MDYKAIIFDLGITLVYSPRIKPFQEIAGKFGVDIKAEDLKKAFAYTDHHFMRNYREIFVQEPKIFYKNYLSILFAYLHLDLPIHKFYDEIFNLSPPREIWVPYPETIDTLKNLKEMGVKVGLVSNWDHTARGLLKGIGISDLFDSIVISSEIEIEKPDSRIFEIALNELEIKSEEALYVGDNYFDDVIGANSVGLKTLLIRRNLDYCEYGPGNYVMIHNLNDVLEHVEQNESKGA